jgi:hypothetical protein
MQKSVLTAGVLSVAIVFGLSAHAHAVVLEPSADTNVEEHTPDSDDTTQPRIQVRSRAVADSGRQHYGYVQFDLSFVDAAINQAAFSLTLQSSLAMAAGDNQVYGLNDIAGNTPQDWTNLTYNTTGNELGKDGDPTTQNLGTFGTTGAEQLWDIGDLPEITGVENESISIDGTTNPELLNFLNSRAGGFATLILVQDDMLDGELLFNSVEDEESLRPMLNLPEFEGPLTGDFNGDLNVDAADYVTWRTGFLTDYDEGDYTDWINHFGEFRSQGSGAVGAATSIPEPASMLLMIISGLFAGMRRDH